MNILITGIEGFVGHYLVKMLPDRMKHVTKIYGTYFMGTESLKNMDDINLVKLDITSRDNVFQVVNDIKPDYIIHLAAQSSVALSWKNPNLTMNVNVTGTINLLDAIREVNKNCRVLIVGSSEQYGKIEVLPVTEEHRLDPQNPYSISKVSQEMLAQLYVKAYGMNIVMTRSFNHIGPLQEPLFVVPDWAKQISEIEKGLKDPIINVGNINVKRDFTDVRDIINAYIMLLDKGDAGQIYNVGSGNAYELKYILEKLLSLSPKKIEIKVDKEKLRPVENEIIQCDNSKITRACGWKIEHGLEDTLHDTLNYWRSRI